MIVARTAPLRRPLRYHGGKWRIAPWIIAHLPAHLCYVEPFGGAASVLLRKPRSAVEVYNDRAGEVVNFFRVLRDQEAALITAIERTPYARAEFNQAREPLAGADEVERARRFYVASWQGWSSPGGARGKGWRTGRKTGRKRSAVEEWNKTSHLWQVARRLKQVIIEEDDAESVIARYDAPETCFYVDPPYPHSTRRRPEHGYLHEMEEEAHRTLARQLHAVSGAVLLSSYPSQLYRELYGGWSCLTCKAQISSGQLATESLWLSPQATLQPSLFVAVEELP